MAVNSMMAINPHLYAKLSYDPVKDFTPVSLIWTSANVLVVHPSNPASSVRELIAQAKADPGKLTYASSGNGTTVHLSGEMFKRLAGIDIVHVPYKGVGPAATDLIGNQVTLLFSDTSALNHVAGKRLKALAVTSSKRLSAAPQLPTMQEAGVAGFEMNSWYSLMGPAGVPKPVVARLNAAAKQAMSAPEVPVKLREFGADVAEDFSSEYLAALILSDLAKYKAFIAATGIRAD
jgi:tripartite-type tricarboxylate transporter receptor subunit TctC